MGDTDAFTERAALLALLDERPWLPGEQRRASWSEIALEVSLRDSASSLWVETHPLTLDGLADPDCVLDAARHRLQAWADADFDMVTVLDAELSTGAARRSRDAADSVHQGNTAI